MSRFHGRYCVFLLKWPCLTFVSEKDSMLGAPPMDIPLPRVKRSTSKGFKHGPRYLQMLIVTDSSVRSFHGTDLMQQYIITQVYIVSSFNLMSCWQEAWYQNHSILVLMIRLHLSQGTKNCLNIFCHDFPGENCQVYLRGLESRLSSHCYEYEIDLMVCNLVCKTMVLSMNLMYV